MAQYRIHDPEELLECPYDRVHMVRAKRFQYHLMKCRKNYTGSDFEKCPFNAKHHVPKPEFRHHLANCPDKAIIEPEFAYNQRRENGDNTLKGCTDTPVYREIDIPTTEDWDSEVSPPVRVGPQYDNTYYNRVQFKDISGLSKQQRAIVADRRLTPQQKMEELNRDSRAVEDDNLRLPKTTAKAAMVRQPQIQPKEQPVSSVFAYSTGRGRGRGVVGGMTPGTAQGQPATMNGVQTAFVPAVPYGRGLGTNMGMPTMGVGMMPASGVGRGLVNPPPGFCVPEVNPSNSAGFD